MSTGSISTAGLSSSQSMSFCEPTAKVVTCLNGRPDLREPSTTPASTRSITPSDSASVWMPSAVWSRSSDSTALGSLPTPSWRHAPSGTRAAMWRAMARSISPGSGGSTVIIGTSLRVTATVCETWMWLRPNVLGIAELTSTTNGTRPMNEAT